MPFTTEDQHTCKRCVKKRLQLLLEFLSACVVAHSGHFEHIL